MWALEVRGSVAGEIAVTQIIDNDEDDVGPLRGEGGLNEEE